MAISLQDFDGGNSGGAGINVGQIRPIGTGIRQLINSIYGAYTINELLDNTENHLEERERAISGTLRRRSEESGNHTITVDVGYHLDEINISEINTRIAEIDNGVNIDAERLETINEMLRDQFELYSSFKSRYYKATRVLRQPKVEMIGKIKTIKI